MLPNILHSYKNGIRQGTLLDKICSRNRLFHLAGTNNNAISILESRVMRDPAQSDLNRLKSLRPDFLVEYLHSFEQFLPAKHLLCCIAERMVVCEAGAGLVVVDQLAGEEACGERPSSMVLV